MTKPTEIATPSTMFATADARVRRTIEAGTLDERDYYVALSGTAHAMLIMIEERIRDAKSLDQIRRDVAMLSETLR